VRLFSQWRLRGGWGQRGAVPDNIFSSDGVGQLLAWTRLGWSLPFLLGGQPPPSNDEQGGALAAVREISFPG